MSILSQKDNPPSKPFECSILETKGVWWIAKLKSRQEKAFAFDLLEKGVDYYLPYYEKKTKRSDGKYRKAFLILFPSYVPFMADNPHMFSDKKRIATILPIKDQDRFRAQLHYIDVAFGAGYQISPIEINNNFSIGELVQVGVGPCKGLFGRIVNMDNRNCLVLNIDALGCALVKISESQVLQLNSVTLN